MSEFAGMTVLITGGGSGIGLATARRLVAGGGRVVLAGRDEARLKTAAAELGDDERVLTVAADVSRTDDLDRLAARIGDRFGGLTGVFANAGVPFAARLGDITEADYELVVGANFKGALFTVQKALPLLNDGASVILNSSNANAKGSDAYGVYAAIKAAVRSLARTWASELRDKGIRVNAVSPGATDTPGLEAFAHQLLPGPDALEEFDQLTAAIPMGRRGEPDEVANAVLFLASDLSSYTTGAEIPVDGGINQI